MKNVKKFEGFISKKDDYYDRVYVKPRKDNDIAEKILANLNNGKYDYNPASHILTINNAKIKIQNSDDRSGLRVDGVLLDTDVNISNSVIRKIHDIMDSHIPKNIQNIPLNDYDSMRSKFK